METETLIVLTLKQAGINGKRIELGDEKMQSSEREMPLILCLVSVEPRQEIAR